MGRRLDSPAVVANAWHHRSDALSSVGTAIGIGGAMALGSQWTVLDPIAAVIVSLLIIMQAVKQIRQSSDELLEKSLPDDVERRIKDIVLEEEGASDIHHLCTRRIGSAVAMEMHVRMPGGMTLAESHERATAIERRLRAEFGQRTHISLHVEPLKPDKGAGRDRARALKNADTGDAGGAQGPHGGAKRHARRSNTGRTAAQGRPFRTATRPPPQHAAGQAVAPRGPDRETSLQRLPPPRQTGAHKHTANKPTMKILITGATGFIGSFIAEEALKRAWTCGPPCDPRAAASTCPTRAPTS